LNLPWRLSKEQISWLKKKMHDKRPDIRALAKEQYEMRFSPARFEEDEPNGDFTDFPYDIQRIWHFRRFVRINKKSG
jgi:hypothetical protein